MFLFYFPEINIKAWVSENVKQDHTSVEMSPPTVTSKYWKQQCVQSVVPEFLHTCPPPPPPPPPREGLKIPGGEGGIKDAPKLRNAY